MEKLLDFQVAARQGGFVQVEESDNGSVLWLRKTIPDAATSTHQRICLDSGSGLVTVYWMTTLGKVVSKSFKSAPSLQAWFAIPPAE